MIGLQNYINAMVEIYEINSEKKNGKLTVCVSFLSGICKCVNFVN